MKIEELLKRVENVQMDIELATNSLDYIKSEVEKLKNNSFEPTPKDWMPKHKEKYWIAHYNLTPTAFYNNEGCLSEPIIKYNRVFQTREECQLFCNIQKAFRDKSREFKRNAINYTLTYDVDADDLTVCCDSYYRCTNLYFDSKETVQNIIDKFGEENIKRYYLGVY